MTYDYEVRSDYLVHWTGKDLDESLDPQWYQSRKSTAVRGSKIVDAYLQRLVDILRHGLWLTEELDIEYTAMDGESVTIPNTPKTCFTELKLSESRKHAKRYGRLGIGVKRPYLITRSGRPVTYFGYYADNNTDSLLLNCSKDLKDRSLLNFFKPMNSTKDLNYDFYSEAEWRILYSDALKKSGLIVDPRDNQNSEAYSYFKSLPEEQRDKLKYLLPLDGWFSQIIYPSIWVKNKAKQDSSINIDAHIRAIKSKSEDHGNRVEGGNWPMEVDLDSCRHF